MKLSPLSLLEYLNSWPWGMYTCISISFITYLFIPDSHGNFFFFVQNFFYCETKKVTLHGHWWSGKNLCFQINYFCTLIQWATFESAMYHNTLCLSLDILHKHCFRFCLETIVLKSQEKLETTLMQNLEGPTKSIMLHVFSKVAYCVDFIHPFYYTL